MTSLTSSLQLGKSLTLRNRHVMASMTRDRAPRSVPDQFTVEYYAQRAGAGLVLSEGVLVEAHGIYIGCCLMFTYRCCRSLITLLFTYHFTHLLPVTIHLLPVTLTTCLSLSLPSTHALRTPLTGTEWPSAPGIFNAEQVQAW